jgi:hypothetical protein
MRESSSGTTPAAQSTSLTQRSDRLPAAQAQGQPPGGGAVKPKTHSLKAWVAIGIFALCVTALNDVSRLIGAIESAGQRAYDAGVFTSFRLQFWNTDALNAAMALWHATQGTPGFDVERLLQWHLGIDGVLFVPTYCTLLWWLLRRAGATQRVAWAMAGATAVADWLETGATAYFFIGRHLAPSSAIWIVQALTFVKWLAIAASLTTVAVLWHHQRLEEGRVARLTLRGRGALASVTVIVIVFAAAVALPAGGPLDQLPDVLRAQFSGGVSWRTPILSTFALGLLATSVATGAALAADPLASGVPRKLLRNRTVLFVAGALSATLLLIGLLREHAWRIAALAPVLVTGAIWAASKLATIVGASDPDRTPHDAWPTPLDADSAARYAGALAGAIVIAGGIGLVRAAFPGWVLGLPGGVFRWCGISLGAAAVVLAGGFLAQRVVLPVIGLDRSETQTADRATRRRRVVGVPAAIVTLVFAAWLMLDPDRAGVIGTTGVIAIGFGALALYVGWLAWVARELAAWEATQTLGIGIRTPWLGIVVAIWLVSSLLNTDGVYHDARVTQTERPVPPRFPSLQSAFAAWDSLQTDTSCVSAQGDVPLVLIAAPGGGIRAAYWTSATLDSLLGGRKGACAAAPIFAMSGVSGGSLGITTWIAAKAAGADGRSAAADMSDDHALASAAAGLFFRDALQPLLPLSTSWRDRAALLEDGWERSGKSPLRDARWSALGTGLTWVPVIVLNGSSVNDGCRVLVANVGRLPTEIDHGCSEAPHAGVLAGPVTSAIDAISSLRARADTSCGTGVELRAATAALLSARFPVVSPSGALIRCRLGPALPRKQADSLRTETYVVDGGYFENSGILTLLQLWRAVEPLVRQKNAEPNARRIVPWLVVTDNHYRSAASAGAPQRPLELVVPLKALTSGSVSSQAALEQMAWGEIAGSGERCKQDETTGTGNSAEHSPAKPDTAKPDTAKPDTAKSDTAKSDTAKPDSSKTPEAPRGCVVVVAPSVSPGVSAPLGWVLSKTSRDNMDEQIRRRLERARKGDDTSLVTLLGMMGKGGQR